MMNTRQKIALRALIQKLGEIDASVMNKYQIKALWNQVDDWSRRVGLLWLTPEEKQECDEFAKQLDEAWRNCQLRNGFNSLETTKAPCYDPISFTTKELSMSEQCTLHTFVTDNDFRGFHFTTAAAPSGREVFCDGETDACLHELNQIGDYANGGFNHLVGNINMADRAWVWNGQSGSPKDQDGNQLTALKVYFS